MVDKPRDLIKPIVLFDLEGNIILVLKIGNRGDIYKR